MSRVTASVVLAGVGMTALVAAAMTRQVIGPTSAVGLGLVAFVACAYFHRTGGAHSVAICAVLAAVFLPMTTNPLGDLFLVGAAGSLLIDPSIRSRPRVRIDRMLEAGLAALAIGGMIGWLFEPAENAFGDLSYYAPSAALGLPPAVAEVGRFVFSTIGLLWLARAWRPSAHEAKAVYWAFAVGNAASCIVGLINGADPGTGRVIGATGHPVFFGLISAVGFAAALAAAWSARTSRTRAVGGLLVAINLYGVLVSGTRSALLLVLLTVALLVLSARRASVTLVVMGLFIASASIGLLAPGVFGNTSTVARIGGDIATSVSDSGRAALRDRTVDIILERPFTGSGFTYILVPHNLVLGTIAAAGVLGLIGFGLITARLTSLVLRIGGRDPTTALALAIGASFFLGSWVINVAWDRWLFWPLVVAVARSGSLDRAHPEPTWSATTSAVDRVG